MVGGNHETPLSFLHCHVEQKIPPIPALVFRARHELHNFAQSLLCPRCEFARAKMHNLSTGNFLLLVKVVILSKHRHQRLTAIRDLRPNKISQCYHVIWRELVEMDFKASKTSLTNRCASSQRPAVKNALKTTNSPSGSGTSSTPGACPTLAPKYSKHCNSCTRPEEILYIPNSTVCPSSSSAIDVGSLTIFFDGAVMVDDDEEEDGIMYCLQRRAVFFTWARSPVVGDLAL
jgi:hypothetical protein